MEILFGRKMNVKINQLATWRLKQKKQVILIALRKVIKISLTVAHTIEA